MRYLSICSGIEAATAAWHPLGWRPAGFAEIADFPSAVLKHHYPDVRNFGDFTTIEADDVGPIDLLVGGTPCQSFSIAGLRGGLADDRGNLALEFLRLAQRTRPRWLVWENVPGVLSSNGGRDFGAILGGLVECGYGFAYRVLDAQYFGLAQRRKRVFVVGYLGDWRRAAAVLFERESLSWNPPPRRDARQGVAVGALAGTSPGGGWRVGADEAAAGHLVAFGGNNRSGTIEIAAALNAHGGSGRCDFDSETFVTAYRTTGNDGVYEMEDLSGCLNTQTDPSAQVLMMPNSGVRRLTPLEFERLQGFQDGWTDVPYRGKPAADGPRYRALGNSMAVPVMQWIGRAIMATDSL